MFLSNKPPRLTTAAKARLNTHSSHKLDNMESRKRSPDGNPPGPPSPSEVILFNNTTIHYNTNHTGPGGRSGQNPPSVPEVPQYEEIHRYMKDAWDRKMYEIKTQNLKVLWIKSEREENASKDGFQTPGCSQPPTPKQKNSPQHTNRK